MTDRTNASAANHGNQPAGAARGHRAVSVEAAAAAGLASSVLTAVALSLLSQFPSLSLDDASLSAWFDDDGHRARLILGLNLLTIGSVAFLWFVAVIRRRLGHRENRFFATAFFGSAMILVATGLAGAGLLAAPAVAMTILDAGTVSPASASLAAGAGGSMLLVIAPRFQAVFVLATANLFRQSEIAPRWLVVASTVTGVALFIIPLVTRSVGLVFWFWVFVVSATLMVTRPAIARRAPTESLGPTGD
jgi:hypothetical protein